MTDQQKTTEMNQAPQNPPAAAAGSDDEQGGTCCLCHNPYQGWGHNPYPLVPRDDYDSRCCDRCNTEEVIPTRLREWVHVAAKAKLHARLKAMGDRRKRR